MNSIWLAQQQKQHPAYVTQWARRHSPFIQSYISSISSRIVTLNLTIYLIPEDHNLKQLIEEYPSLTTECLPEWLGRSFITVQIHLHELSKAWKYRVWVPHEFSQYQLQQRVDTNRDWWHFIAITNGFTIYNQWRKMGILCLTTYARKNFEGKNDLKMVLLNFFDQSPGTSMKEPFSTRTLVTGHR